MEIIIKENNEWRETENELPETIFTLGVPKLHVHRYFTAADEAETALAELDTQEFARVKKMVRDDYLPWGVGSSPDDVYRISASTIYHNGQIVQPVADEN